MSNVVTLRRTLSGETALQRLDRELAAARRARAKAARVRDEAHKQLCHIEASIIMLEADRETASTLAKGANCNALKVRP